MLVLLLDHERNAMPAESIRFPGFQGQQLAALLDRPPDIPRAYALFAHCFTCSKDSKAATYNAQALAAQFKADNPPR